MHTTSNAQVMHADPQFHATFQTGMQEEAKKRYLAGVMTLLAGSCATAAFVDLTTRKLTVGNLGDSRVVLGRYIPSVTSTAKSKVKGYLVAVPLTVDHAASDPEEQRLLRQLHKNTDCADLLVNEGSEENSDWR